VPGVVILDMVIRFAQQRSYRVAGVKSAKFKTPLLPETPFHVELSPCEEGLDFRVVAGAKPLVHGTLRCCDKSTPEPT